MCLTTHFKNKAKAEKWLKGEILKKDKVVYKKLFKTKKGYKSPFQEMSYKPGIHYYQTGKKKVHAYIFSTNILRPDHSYGRVTMGLHSYTSKKWVKLYKGSNDVIVKMIIPKGALVWRSPEDKEIASTELIFPHQ